VVSNRFGLDTLHRKLKYNRSIKTVSSRQQQKNSKQIQRRKPGAERKAEIATVAAELFADHGFSVGTREISAKLGVTQATLYKHYSSKNDLIEEIFKTRYLDDKSSRFADHLQYSEGEFNARLSFAYAQFLAGISKTSMKLFHRASYDGLEIAKRYSPHLDTRILFPVLEELRSSINAPTLAKVKATQQEREIALMLHSSIVFLGIRKHVYNIDFKGKEAELVELYVNTWLEGAQSAIRC